MVKLLFFDMDGAGANSWNDIEKFWNDMDEAGFRLPLNCRFFQTGEKRGLTRGVTQRIIDWFNEK